MTPPWKWPKNCISSGFFFSAIDTLPGSAEMSRMPADFGKPGRSMMPASCLMRSAPLMSCALRRDADRQLLDAAHETRIDPLGLADHLDLLEALQHLLPDDAQLQLG